MSDVPPAGGTPLQSETPEITPAGVDSGALRTHASGSGAGDDATLARTRTPALEDDAEAAAAAGVIAPPDDAIQLRRVIHEMRRDQLALQDTLATVTATMTAMQSRIDTLVGSIPPATALTGDGGALPQTGAGGAGSSVAPPTIVVPPGAAIMEVKLREFPVLAGDKGKGELNPRWKARVLSALDALHRGGRASYLFWEH